MWRKLRHFTEDDTLMANKDMKIMVNTISVTIFGSTIVKELIIKLACYFYLYQCSFLSEILIILFSFSVRRTFSSHSLR